MAENLQGIKWKLLNVLLTVLISVVFKLMGKGVSIFQIYFLNKLIAWGLVVSFIVGLREKHIDLQRFHFEDLKNKIYIIRSILGMVGIMLWFYLLKFIPLTEATAISYITPIFATLLAIVFLKEKLTKIIIFALMTGLVGAYIILQPNFQQADTIWILALLYPMIWAFNSNLTRIQSMQHHPLRQAFCLFTFDIIFTCPLALMNWQTVNIEYVGWILLLGILSFANTFSHSQAFRTTRLVVLMPLTFSKLIFASFFGYLIFHETLRLNTLIGSLIIVFALSFMVKFSQKSTA